MIPPSSDALPTVPGGESARDERLATIVSRMADELRGGGEPDIDALTRAHPDLAVELRSLWSALLLAHVFTGEVEAESSLPAEVAEPDAGLPERGVDEFPRIDARRGVPRVGKYELLAELGRGGMGVVYKARHRGLNRIVALKMLRRGSLGLTEELARFRQEAVSAARLDHPHVVPVYEVGESDGRPYFTMQFVEGSTLAERLADGPLPPREIATLLAPICDAVHAAHLQGVLHRDLKPSNILIDREGRPLVTDFGLAKRVEDDGSLTHTGAILGTPTHMAPEQAAGGRGRVGPPSDVYSLGVILYQMLTGRPPLLGATPMETVLLVLEQEPLPPRLLNPRADVSLEMIALRCLQKPPDLRYESARALADDLRAFLADEPISARSGRFNQVIARWLAETHHAVVLQNWGVLWMWHSLVLLLVSLATNAMQWRGVTSPWPYVGLWIAGLGTWAGIFWALRRRSGPVTFVERQIAHVWAGSIVSIALLFPVERLLGFPVLELSPVLGLISGCVFLVKAGMLSGMFYLPALALFATAPLMALLQRSGYPLGVALFGVVSAACFFFPGLKYFREAQRRR